MQLCQPSISTSSYNLPNVVPIFSKIGFQIAFALYLAPNRGPKYCIGNEAVLQPKIEAKSSIEDTSPTGTNSDFPKLILKPEVASNQVRTCPRCKS
jgi:hypothetical protein